MDAKLTLKLNKETINMAKKYAKENNISLSRLIEKQLNALVRNDEPKDLKSFSREVNELIGYLKQES